MLSRVLATMMWLSVVGLPLTGGQSLLCREGMVSFQGSAQHQTCGCGSANCTEDSCCCGDQGNAGFNDCACSDTGLPSLITMAQPVTFDQSSVRTPFLVEAFEGALYAAPFLGTRFSYPLDYGGMGVLLQTCSLRS